MVFGKSKKAGLMDIVRCDEPSYLIWKWHPKGYIEGESSRENTIRWGSSLRVKDGEVAVFLYNSDDGENEDFIEGPYDQLIETNNFPVLSNILGLAYAGASPLQAEVYFINLSNLIQVKFGVPYFDVYDPRFTDFGVPIAVRGTISFKINDYRQFVKLHRLSTFNIKDFQTQIRDAVNRYVKDVVTNAPAAHNIPVIQIESKISQINDMIEYDITERLKEDFGVTVTSVDINAIEIDKTSDEYAQLISVTRNLSMSVMQAETAANVKNIHDRQRIDAENYQESLRIQREEGQYATHKQTQTANYDAFKVEAQTQVGIAGANALGKIEQNNGTDINFGSNNGGFNPLGLMAGTALGGAIGQNIANTLNNTMPGTIRSSENGIVPPPVPKEIYYIGKNGQQAGPYDLDDITKMAISREIDGDTFIWKAGMENWEKANTLSEIAEILKCIPPVLPPEIK